MEALRLVQRRWLIGDLLINFFVLQAFLQFLTGNRGGLGRFDTQPHAPSGNAHPGHGDVVTNLDLFPDLAAKN